MEGLLPPMCHCEGMEFPRPHVFRPMESHVFTHTRNDPGRLSTVLCLRCSAAAWSPSGASILHLLQKSLPPMKGLHRSPQSRQGKILLLPAPLGWRTSSSMSLAMSRTFSSMSLTTSPRWAGAVPCPGRSLTTLLMPSQRPAPTVRHSWLALDPDHCCANRPAWPWRHAH